MPGAAHSRVGAVRTFAFVAAAVLVFTGLLPESLAEIGLPALAVFAVALVVPSTLERLAHRRHGAHHHHGEHADDHAAGLELGYLGLLLHSFGDGIAVGAVPGSHGDDGTPLALVFSIAAHTVPVTALFVVAFAAHRGRRSALLRAVGFGVSVAAGIAAAEAVPDWVARPFEPWVTAAVAGLLLHVIAHDWPIEPVRTRSQRVLEMLAIAAGLAIALLPGGHATDEHGPGHHHHGGIDVGAAFLDLALDTAPALLLGLVAGACVQALGSRLPPRWLEARGGAGQATRGALLCAPLPVCAWSALPSASALARHGLPAALVVAFLLSTPALGIETFALSVRFLDWPFALARLIAAPLAAGVAALLLARAAAAPARPIGAADAELALAELAPPGDRRPLAARALAHFDELLFHVGAWTLLGLLAASYVEVALPEAALAAFAASGLDVVIVAAAALPSYLCASSLVPLVAVLVGKGLSPGAALAALVLGPAINVATAAFLARTFGRRAAWWGIAGLVATTVVAAGVANALALRPPGTGVAGASDAHGLASLAAIALLVVLIARGVWRSGLRAWLASLQDAFSSPRAAAATSHVHEPAASGLAEHGEIEPAVRPDLRARR